MNDSQSSGTCNRSRWPQAAGMSVGRVGGNGMNEDCFSIAGRQAIVLDGITGDGTGGGLVAASYARARWLQSVTDASDPEEDILKLSDDTARYLRKEGVQKSGAACVRAAFEESGVVRIAALGDSAACYVSPGGASRFLTEPQRGRAGGLREYVGAPPQFARHVQAVSAKIAPGQSCVVLMTDGAWEYTPVSFLEHAFEECAGDLRLMADTIVKYAQNEGSADDITCVVIG